MKWIRTYSKSILKKKLLLLTALMIISINAGNGIIPGTQFDYGSAHLQVAGLMAVKAAGVDSWQDLFETFQQETGLFPNGAYNLPSIDNPRLAGGMHWQGREYADFIRAFFKGELLTEHTRALMLTDQIALVEIINSPADDLDEAEVWHYGFGIWRECHNTTFDCEVISYYSTKNYCK